MKKIKNHFTHCTDWDGGGGEENLLEHKEIRVEKIDDIQNFSQIIIAQFS